MSHCFERHTWEGTLIQKWKNDAGQLHREDGPAIVETAPNGIVIFQKYFVNGVWHRDDGPAIIERNSFTGDVTYEVYYVNGKLHRLDGPAVTEITWSTDAPEYRLTTTQSYYVNGERHREGGPAHIAQTEGGFVLLKEYYRHGKLTERWVDGVKQKLTKTS